jgi:protein-S-isoprenylcysteine O-methyltransferase Ste14
MFSPAVNIIALLFFSVIFFIGAFQIYAEKIRQSGLVTRGIYSRLRHPQYTGLILFCIGFLLLWGRFVTYILFFIVVLLYYLLAKKEEQDCLDRFGQEYADYMKNSSFLFPIYATVHK